MKARNAMKIHKKICTSMFFAKKAWCYLDLLALKLIFHVRLKKGVLFFGKTWMCCYKLKSLTFEIMVFMMRHFMVSPTCQAVKNGFMTCSERIWLMYGYQAQQLQCSSAGSNVFPHEKVNILHSRKISRSWICKQAVPESWLLILHSQVICG